MGRMKIALKFNEMVRNGDIGPVMPDATITTPAARILRSAKLLNIKDGSNIMADMATQCFAGNAARGMSLVALHNGGGVGIGKVINGGFGRVWMAANGGSGDSICDPLGRYGRRGAARLGA